MIWVWAAGACVVGILAWAFFVEPRWYRLRRIKLKDQKKLRKPITILHLSDVHFQKKEGGKKHFFQKLSMLNPDLLFLTGDIIENDEGIDTAVQLISGIRARYGAFLVPGNHEYYDYHWLDTARYYLRLGNTAVTRNRLDLFISKLKQIGVRTLINESVKLEVHGNHVWIGGTDDPITQKVDFNRTLEDMGPQTFNILLTHHLDSILKLNHHGIDFVLAGHTHGGQVRIPFIGPLVCETGLPRRYVDGLNHYKGMLTFVSRGVGTGRLLTPRFACRPEAVFFELSG